MYKFIKIKRMGEISHWYFVPVSEGDIISHWEKYIIPIIKDGIRELTNDTITKPIHSHSTNQYGQFIERTFLRINGGIFNIGVVEQGNKAMIDMLENRINSFNKHHRTLLTNNMIETFLLDTDEITEEKKMETLTFPDETQYCIEDVRYIMWDGGIHWYAKIGKLDICDKQGNYKWNTKTEAIKAAKWWIKNN